MNKLLFNISTIVITILCFLAFSFNSCTSSSANKGVLIGQHTKKGNLLTAKSETLKGCFTRFNAFKDSWPSGFKIQYFEETGAYFLNAKGKNSAGKEIIMRVTIDLQDSNFYMKKSSIGESCTGDSCSGCTFKSKGGCLCLDTGSCNHYIEKQDEQ